VRVRHIELGVRSLVVRPRRFIRVSVSTDARSYRWRIAGRTGTVHARRLVLRAPAKPGRYVLFVDTRGRGDRMTVLVRRPGLKLPGLPPARAPDRP
jgi:hypothetical protein